MFSRTALHWAAKRNHAPIIEILLQHGADKAIKTADGKLAEDLCCSQETAKLLGKGELNRVLQFIAICVKDFFVVCMVRIMRLTFLYASLKECVLPVLPEARTYKGRRGLT